MNKLSMLVALMCIIFIPVMSMQAPTVTGDDLKGEWIDEETNNIIEVIEFGGKYYAKVKGFMKPDSTVIYTEDDNYPNSKYIGSVLFERSEFANGIWSGGTRFYDYTTGRNNRYEIEVDSQTDVSRVKITLKWFLAKDKTTHWTKRD